MFMVLRLKKRQAPQERHGIRRAAPLGLIGIFFGFL
jgi:hypothetical protein